MPPFSLTKPPRFPTIPDQPLHTETEMRFILGGTGESGDLVMIIFGTALLFGLISFILIFPSWHRRRMREQREAEYLATLASSMGDETSQGADEATTGKPEHRHPVGD